MIKNKFKVVKMENIEKRNHKSKEKPKSKLDTQLSKNIRKEIKENYEIGIEYYEEVKKHDNY